MRGALPRLEGGESYLVALANAVPTAENIEHYVRLVKEKATLRRLIAACAEVQSRAYGEFGNYEEFLDEAENAIFKVAQQTRKESYSHRRRDDGRGPREHRGAGPRAQGDHRRPHRLHQVRPHDRRACSRRT